MLYIGMLAIGQGGLAILVGIKINIKMIKTKCSWCATGHRLRCGWRSAHPRGDRDQEWEIDIRNCANKNDCHAGHTGVLLVGHVELTTLVGNGN